MQELDSSKRQIVGGKTYTVDQAGSLYRLDEDGPHLVLSREAYDEVIDAIRNIGTVAAEACAAFAEAFKATVGEQSALWGFLSVDWDPDNFPDVDVNDDDEIVATTTRWDGCKMVATFKGDDVVEWEEARG